MVNIEGWNPADTKKELIALYQPVTFTPKSLMQCGTEQVLRQLWVCCCLWKYAQRPCGGSIPSTQFVALLSQVLKTRLTIANGYV
jgi:hypothetical protein